jgi:hypothetical protein
MPRASILLGVTDLALDNSRSHVRLQTFAEGLLARLAHDLELACGELTGTASRDDGSATKGTASIDAPVRAIAVSGVLGKDGRVDERGLSASEKSDAATKMQHDVFHARHGGVVHVEAHLDGASARVRVVPPNGKAVEVVVRTEVRAEGEGVRATGAFDLSLSSLGSDVVKGPMNAFRVKDRVKVLFDVVFAPRGESGTQPA